MSQMEQPLTNRTKKNLYSPKSKNLQNVHLKQMERSGSPEIIYGKKIVLYIHLEKYCKWEEKSPFMAAD